MSYEHNIPKVASFLIYEQFCLSVAFCPKTEEATFCCSLFPALFRASSAIVRFVSSWIVGTASAITFFCFFSDHLVHKMYFCDSRERSDWVTWRPDKICSFSVNKSNHCRSKLTSLGNLCKLCPVFAWISRILIGTTWINSAEKIRRYRAAMTSGSCCVPSLMSQAEMAFLRACSISLLWSNFSIRKCAQFEILLIHNKHFTTTGPKI